MMGGDVILARASVAVIGQCFELRSEWEVAGGADGTHGSVPSHGADGTHTRHIIWRHYR